MPTSNPRHEEQELAADLERALGTDQIRLEYQPVVRLGNGQVAGAEALVRWRHPRRGMLAPADFVPVAERSGLIDRLGAMVLEQACRTAAGWPRPGSRGAHFVSVNMSVEQLSEGSSAEGILALVGQAGLAPSSLILEVTSSVGLHGEAVARTASALREAGVRIALDDFGSATSLRDLKQLPADFVKLDREFVVDVDGPPADAAFALALLRLGEARGAEAVAKGIESREQAWRLAELGCRYGQGYFFSKPLGATGMVAVLRQGTLRG
ncbi:MAG TPA: EAL domain-containing protein [Candidatus Limnocylindrales bacterium]|jgi:EAL domain-containing protein (putative c-di-GMP-specific phosphodiesterase class I)